MYKTTDIYEVIQDALDADQIYSVDSKLGNGSTDTYEIETKWIDGKDAHLIAIVKHQHEHYPWQPGDDKLETYKFKIKVEMIE